MIRESVCKPGPVLNGHLSRHGVAAMLKPPPRGDRAGRVPLHGVAPDRVYSGGLSPKRRVVSYTAFPPLPPEGAAVCFCCTRPDVAIGGRYPLSLPYGARTFLTRCLSACARGRSAGSRIIGIIRFFPSLSRRKKDRTRRMRSLEKRIKGWRGIRRYRQPQPCRRPWP